MKKILLSALLITGSSFAMSFEYPYLYKDPRALGMGGAYTAVGGTSSAVFYNPAGLSKINRKAGWEVNLLKLSVGWGKNSVDFFNDINDALDATDGQYVQPPDGDNSDDQLVAVDEVIKKYQGENLHITANNYSSISKKFEKIAFTIGFLINAKSDSIPHQGFGVEGVIEEHGNITAGPVLGLSYDAFDGALNIGASVKYMYRKTVDHYFTTRELVEHQDDLDTYITDTVAKDGTAFGGDLGLIYNFDNPKFNKFKIVKWLKPSVGLSALNIGDLDFGDAGKVPMTINAGIALHPQIPIFDWTFALDYVDITQNIKQDKDKGKRIRTGLEVGLLDKKWIGLKLRTGLYQGYLSAGAELRLLLLTATFTTYEEEVGAYAGQKGDRRYLVTLALGW